jgi:hypothetical protein
MIEPFKEPVYVTRPVLPDLDRFGSRPREIWDSKWLSILLPTLRRVFMPQTAAVIGQGEPAGRL